LRLLLHHVPGATSFEDLACTNKHLQHPTQHASFKEACQQRGLLQDDAEWAQCMEEVVSMASVSCLKALFVALLVFNAVANPLALWERFKDDMAEDFLYQARQVSVFYILKFFLVFNFRIFFSNICFQFFYILIRHVLGKIIIHVNHLTYCVSCIVCRIKIPFAQKNSHINFFFFGTTLPPKYY